MHTIRRTVAALALTAPAVLVINAGTVADAHTVRGLPACKYEDGSGQRATCVWDARHMGNGEGRSFKAVTHPGRDDRFIRIGHRRAHQLIARDERTACVDGWATRP